MHTATQLLAQRAPPASRTTKAARWQPYFPCATAPPLPLRSPYIHTPNQSVPSPAPTPVNSHTISRPTLPPTVTQSTKDVSSSASSSKQKFATGLIDQAVTTLSDIWRPHNIPSIFLPPAQAGGCSFPPSAIHSHSQSKPVGGTSSQSSFTQPPPQHTSISGHDTSTAALSLLASANGSDQILPLRTFVHEVLKRSRTSGNVLQTALCYLEAVRHKIPELLEEENMGIRAHYQPESRIQQATPEELQADAELCALEDDLANTLIDTTVDESIKTIRVTDSNSEDFIDEDQESLCSMQVESSSISMCPSSSPSLPSPLLCPRRAFLASLILASKFSLDKCYSNRAWAKLSGLPPREIGRCERALGQALQWRLWVGKCAIGSSGDTFINASSRPVTRSQSEPTLSATLSNGPFLNKDEPPTKQPMTQIATSNENIVSPRSQVGIRRCLSLPAETMALPALLSSSFSDSVLHQTVDQAVLSNNSATSSPSPPTPTLTYSPLSTDSSGDKSIPPSSTDDFMSGSQPWASTVAASCENNPVSFGSNLCRLDGKDYARQLAVLQLQSQPNAVAVVESDVATYGANYMWSADTRYLLEATEVH